MSDTTARKGPGTAREQDADKAAAATRRVAAILGLEGVGATAIGPAGARSDDVLEGRVDGWIVLPMGESGGPAAGSNAAAMDGAVLRAVDATRAVVARADAQPSQVLDALRAVLDIDELFLLREQDDRIMIVAGPGVAGPTVVPDEVRSELRGIVHEDPLAPGALHQLAAVLGAKSAHTAAAFSGDASHMELLIAGWSHEPGVSPPVLSILARVAGMAWDALADRRADAEVLVAKERERIAGEIHDGLTQALTSAVLELSTLTHRLTTDPTSATVSLGEVTEDVRHSLLQVRGMLFDLTDGTTSTPQPMDEYVRDAAARWHLPVEVAVDADLDVDGHAKTRQLRCSRSCAKRSRTPRSTLPPRKVQVRVRSQRSAASPSRSRTTDSGSIPRRPPSSPAIWACGWCVNGSPRSAERSRSTRPQDAELGSAPGCPWTHKERCNESHDR